MMSANNRNTTCNKRNMNFVSALPDALNSPSKEGPANSRKDQGQERWQRRHHRYPARHLAEAKPLCAQLHVQQGLKNCPLGAQAADHRNEQIRRQTQNSAASNAR